MEEDEVCVVENSTDGAFSKQPCKNVTAIQNSAAEIPKVKTKLVMPKPIMVSQIENVINFTAKIESECKKNFSATILILTIL